MRVWPELLAGNRSMEQISNGSSVNRAEKDTVCHNSGFILSFLVQHQFLNIKGATL